MPTHIWGFQMYYGFTIKSIKANHYASKEELAEVMYSMINFNKAKLHDHVYETDSMGRYHIHGTMTARKGLLLSRFKRPFTHIHIDPLKTEIDLKNWTEYIGKQYDPNNIKEIKKAIKEDYCFLNLEVPYK